MYESPVPFPPHFICIYKFISPWCRENRTYIYGDASRDGIGKFYMGREISKVMGHLGASWLERPKREQEERTDLLIQGLDLKQTDIIADIGAGSGYFSFRMAKLVPQGKVFAVDISPQMIGIVRSKMAKEKVTNVVPIQSTIKQTKLPPNSVDAALIVDAYHEFSHPLRWRHQFSILSNQAENLSLSNTAWKIPACLSNCYTK